jgi:hypothetical protein
VGFFIGAIYKFSDSLIMFPRKMELVE